MRTLVFMFMLVFTSLSHASNFECRLLFGKETVDVFHEYLNEGYAYRQPEYPTFLHVADHEQKIIKIFQDNRVPDELMPAVLAVTAQSERAVPFLLKIFEAYYNPSEHNETITYLLTYYQYMYKYNVVGDAVVKFEEMVFNDVVRGWVILERGGSDMDHFHYGTFN